MKRLAFSALALLPLIASPSPACDRSTVVTFHAPLVAVPLLVEDPFGVRVYTAPVVEPLFIVPQPVFVPQFHPRAPLQTRVRLFVR